MTEMNKNLKIYAFADEADFLVDGQIAAMKRNGLDGLEIRNVDGASVSDITLEKAREVRKKLEDNGLVVWSVGSPIGKIDVVSGDWNGHMDKFRHTLEIAHELEAKNIRLFSFYIPEHHNPNDYKEEVINRMGKFLDIAKGSGVCLCHENEKGIYGDIATRCLDIHKALPEIKGIFDPANFVQCEQNTMEAWDMLQSHIKYGKEAICYNQVTEVNALIASGKIIQARKAYLTLSGNEQVCITNKEALSDLDDLDDYKMTKSLVYPNATVEGLADTLPNDWNRTLTDTEDGIRLTYAQVSNDYHSTRTKYAVDGAHMRLTFHVPADANDTANTCDTSKTVGLTISNSNMNNNGNQGLSFKIQVATGQLYCSVDGTALDFTGHEDVYSSTITDRLLMPEDEFDRSATTLDIKTSIDADENFVLNLNGYEFTVAKSVWEGSQYYGEEVRFKVGQQGKLLDCTWNFIHGGTDICCESLADAETKIEFCYSTTPIKANVEAARAAYDDLSDELKAIVINYDKLTSAEANATETDFYHYGLTEATFLTSANNTDWDTLISRTQVSNGWNIDFHGASNTVYKVREDRAIVLDGAHIGLSVEHDGTNDNFYLTLANSNTKDGSNFLYIRLETKYKDDRGGGELSLYYGDNRVSTEGLPDNWSSTTNDRVLFPVDNSNEMDVRFDVDASGNVYVTVNGSYIKVTKEQLQTISFDATQSVYVGVAPNGTNPSITLHYSISGNTEPSYDEVTGDTNGDDAMNVRDLARMKSNEEAEIKDILYYRTSSDLDKDGNSCDAEDLDLLRKELVK